MAILLVSGSRRAPLLEAAFATTCGGWLLVLLLNWRAPLSLAPVVLVLVAAAQPGAWGRLRTTLPHNRPALALLAWEALLLLSGFWSEDQAEWRHLLFRFLPFVAVALAFTLARPLGPATRYALGLGLVGATTAVMLATLVLFGRDFANQNALINLSQTMPAATGMFHIHFGLVATISCWAAWPLAQAARARGQRAVAAALWAAAAVLVVGLHVLAYRSALLAFYGVGALVALRTLGQRGRQHWGALLLVVLVLAPVAAYQVLAPVRQRVGNTLYDLGRFRTGQDINQYSLSQRLAAWSNAAVLLRQHGLLGVAPADVPLELARQYERRSFGLQLANRVQLHNEYLAVWLGLGVPGLLWLLATLLGPLFGRAGHVEPCAAGFLVAMALVMLVDTPFALKGGLNVFVLGYGLLVVAPRQRALVQP